ncbi:MAG: WGR domain-containing protein [Myxococcota bacterium]
MKTRLVYQDAKSHKFWEVHVDGAEHTVRYGKVGTSGQSKTKSFDSEAEATVSAERLIASKLKKGYERSDPNASEEAESMTAVATGTPTNAAHKAATADAADVSNGAKQRLASAIGKLVGAIAHEAKLLETGVVPRAHPPASSDALAAIAAAYDSPLPDWLRAFLSLHDGYEKLWNRADIFGAAELLRDSTRQRAFEDYRQESLVFFERPGDPGTPAITVACKYKDWEGLKPGETLVSMLPEHTVAFAGNGGARYLLWDRDDGLLKLYDPTDGVTIPHSLTALFEREAEQTVDCANREVRYRAQSPDDITDPAKDTTLCGVRVFQHARRRASEHDLRILADGRIEVAFPKGSEIRSMQDTDHRRSPEPYASDSLPSHLAQCVEELGGDPSRPKRVAIRRRMLAVTSGNETIVFDRQTNAEQFRVEGPATMISCIALSPDERLLAVCGEKRIRIWDLHTNEERVTLKGGIAVCRAAAFADATRLVTASIRIAVWDLSRL